MLTTIIPYVKPEAPDHSGAQALAPARAYCADCRELILVGDEDAWSCRECSHSLCFTCLEETHQADPLWVAKHYEGHLGAQDKSDQRAEFDFTFGLCFAVAILAGAIGYAIAL